MIQENFDFLVIGSGIAGLNFAIEASKLGTVCIVTKSKLIDSNSSYAQGGIAVAIHEFDNPLYHIQDTLKAGAGLCNEKIVETVCHEVIPIIKNMISRGMSFTKNNQGILDLGREGGHSKNRILHVADQTGKALILFLIDEVLKNQNITILEDTLVVDLITEMNNQKKECYGAYILESNENIKTLTAKYTCLATGGLGQIYTHTTNPIIATGDGISMAYLHGASIQDLEFIQFHPTVLYSDTKPSFLLSEALRGFGAKLVNSQGEYFMSKYNTLEELAPRDIVSMAIYKELELTNDNYVYLTLKHLPENEIKVHFPFLYSTLLDKYKLDLTKDNIPVVPAAHYSCGGISVDINGLTDINNLYAIGEVSSTGLHGANRLASNSLAEALVFSNRAVAHIKNIFSNSIHIIANTKYLIETQRCNLDISKTIAYVQSLMEKYAGIIRSNDNLKYSLEEIQKLYMQVYNLIIFDKKFIEMKNLIITSYLVLMSAFNRKESRGCHQNTDYNDTRTVSNIHTILQL